MKYFIVLNDKIRHKMVQEISDNIEKLIAPDPVLQTMAGMGMILVETSEAKMEKVRELPEVKLVETSGIESI